jgi:UDP-glucuronate 4-epimerase
MADYLVSGAAGFIGAAVSEMLLADGHTVVGVDDMNEAYDLRVKEYRLERLRASPCFTFHKIDISDPEAVTQVTISNTKFDAIINLAARVGVRASTENPWVYVQTNVTGTLNLLEICRRYGIKKFIIASTSSVYGGNPPLPTPESADSDHPLQPYAASKKGAELMCHSYHHLYGIDVSVLRYFTVYGPAGRPDMSMFRFVQWISEGRPVRINGDGKQSRGFAYVEDIAQGTIAALRPLGYEVINLGGREVIAINELVKILEKTIGRKARIEHYPAHPADVLTNQADVTRAKRLLSWEPQVSIEEGTKRLVDWYNVERSWAADVVTA